ncbi:MAG: hypothetical protein ACRENG_22290 [bacterium]
MNGNLLTFGKRLAKLEDEVAVLRRELTKTLSFGGAQKQSHLQNDVLSNFWADKTLLQKAFDQFFRELGIKGKPIPAEDLQKMMGELGLEPNELSHAITAAREE